MLMSGELEVCKNGERLGFLSDGAFFGEVGRHAALQLLLALPVGDLQLLALPVESPCCSCMENLCCSCMENPCCGCKL